MMTAQAAQSGAVPRGIVEDEALDAMMALSCAASVVVHTHHRMPTARERLALGDAVARVLRLGRLGVLDAAPPMSGPEAIQTFRTALRLALRAAPRAQLVAIFNGEDADAESTVRKDFQ